MQFKMWLESQIKGTLLIATKDFYPDIVTGNYYEFFPDKYTVDLGEKWFTLNAYQLTTYHGIPNYFKELGRRLVPEEALANLKPVDIKINGIVY